MSINLLNATGKKKRIEEKFYVRQQHSFAVQQDISYLIATIVMRRPPERVDSVSP